MSNTTQTLVLAKMEKMISEKGFTFVRNGQFANTGEIQAVPEGEIVSERSIFYNFQANSFNLNPRRDNFTPLPGYGYPRASSNSPQKANRLVEAAVAYLTEAR